MKSISRDKATGTKESPYPKLMRSTYSESVLLLTARGVGTLVHRGSRNAPLGTHRNFWAMGHMVDFDGTIELSNE